MIVLVCPECQIPLRQEENGYRCTDCGYSLQNHGGVFSSNFEFTPSGFSEDSRKHLSALEESHFWFKGRREKLETIIHRILPGKIQSAIEVGCGSGYFLPVLEGYCQSVTGADGHLASLHRARQVAGDVTLVHTDITSLPVGSNEFDFVCAIDVLEHLEPSPFLREMHRIIKPGGKLLLSVPAFQSLWSSVDEKARHRCRYRLNKLEQELEESGFKVLGWTHFQFLLFPLVWIARRFADKSGRHSAESNPPAWVGGILRRINSFEVRALSRFSLPFGSTLIVWAEPE